MLAIVGEAGLSRADRRALTFAEEFERTFVGQGRTRRSLAETIEAGWRLLDPLPVEDLLKLNAELLAAREQQRREVGEAGS
jgi:V/A-type H+-transporting ATPase subunit B